MKKFRSAVLACGDRNWIDQLEVLERFEKLPRGTLIIEGGATGADATAKRMAHYLKLDLIEAPANWWKLGRKAGPIRNILMLDILQIVCNKPKVIAFHSNLKKSKGTLHTVTEARRRGIPVEVIKAKE